MSAGGREWTNLFIFIYVGDGCQTQSLLVGFDPLVPLCPTKVSPSISKEKILGIDTKISKPIRH